MFQGVGFPTPAAASPSQPSDPEPAYILCFSVLSSAGQCFLLSACRLGGRLRNYIPPCSKSIQACSNPHHTTGGVGGDMYFPYVSH